MFSLIVLTFMLQSASTDFTAMSFNIRYDNPEDGPSAWPHRVEWVANEMVKADLIGAQEALAHQVDQLATQLSGYEWVGVGRDDGEDAGEFVPIFYKAEVFELLDTVTFWLSETPDVPGSRGWDAALPRIATAAYLSVRGTDFRFWVINAHFDHRGNQARLESAKLLTSHARMLAEDAPVLMLGDFNTTPETEVYAALTTDLLQDARTVSKNPPEGPIGTFSGFVEREPLPEARIDYVFVSPAWVVQSYEAVVAISESRYVSDHLPVKVRIRLNQ
jgi:endonuclease/exonuclease/phosphatase family metal-dependent hydrolase